MYAQGSKSKRYDNECFDFIIPFLINQSVQKPKQSQPSFKRFSVPNCLRQSQSKDLRKIAKIYNIKNQKSRKAISYHKIAASALQEQTSTVKKTQSATYYTPIKKANKQDYAFIKVHSQLNYSPVSEMPSKKIRHYYGSKIKKEEEKQKEQRGNSPLLGITFRQKPKQFLNLTTQQIVLAPENEMKLESFRNEVKKSMKYWKQKKEWDKNRGINVDLIVNRNCKNFKDMMLQYKRRLQIDQKAKIFIFDSKDSWMKRVLIDRGWIENTNKASKAFHLHWSNKIYKERLFSQQTTNHYDKSYMITTKIGLHNLLKKYGLTYLQPKTFDLATERQLFIQQYQKTQFACFIKKFLEKFEFQEAAVDLKIENLLEEMKHFSIVVQRQKENLKNQVIIKLSQVLKHCQSILSNLFVTYDHELIREISESINSSYSLTNLQEEAIRIIRDFQTVLAKQSIISHYSRIGTESVWITKSKISSKGVGITLYNSLELILKHQNRLAQKYIQKPLIIDSYPFLSRKFDLRIWVLLVGNNPEAYYHQRFYGRICYDSYSVDPQNLKNESVHLTNYSHNKQLFSKNSQLSQSIVVPQMLFNAVYESYKFNYRQKFYHDVQKITRKLMSIFSNQIVNKQVKNNFQLFGLDFLLDSALHLHLLEVNLAAHCEERHQSLTEMLENMGQGILNILENRELANYSKQSHGWVNIK